MGANTDRHMRADTLFLSQHQYQAGTFQYMDTALYGWSVWLKMWAQVSQLFYFIQLPQHKPFTAVSMRGRAHIAYVY